MNFAWAIILVIVAPSILAIVYMKKVWGTQVKYSAEMAAEQKEAQRRSFAYGNTSLDNPSITRDVVNEAADRLKSQSVDNVVPEGSNKIL